MPNRQTRGGKRLNAGRPNKYTSPVKKWQISAPMEAVQAIKKLIRIESDKYLLKRSPLN